MLSLQLQEPLNVGGPFMLYDMVGTLTCNCSHCLIGSESYTPSFLTSFLADLGLFLFSSLSLMTYNCWNFGALLLVKF